ncbi:hypothetical protein Zmor_014109 [Zophobas morio]|uniref:Uncharacterized protein n=1 Tax=Zophobas morio TaxID=2755281 RepID=A0AA38IKD3_9CUCU|nr:hypothetical protein Zmor_014109 [Zophobas morio]
MSFLLIPLSIFTQSLGDFHNTESSGPLLYFLTSTSKFYTRCDKVGGDSHKPRNLIGEAKYVLKLEQRF